MAADGGGQLTQNGRQKYEKPPIVEAVIELRFDQTVPLPMVEKVATKGELNYRTNRLETRIDAQLRFDGEDQVDLQESHRHIGKRLTTTDQIEVLLLQEDKFACAQLAPYSGWDLFFQRFQRDWDMWHKVVGYQQINRLGLRFVNRIDVPKEQAEGADVSRFVNAYPTIPSDGAEAVSAFTMQFVRPLECDNAAMKVTVGTTESPVPQFISILLDIDVFVQSGIPTKLDEVWSLLNRLRGYKNQTFEECITDETRRLFD